MRETGERAPELAARTSGTGGCDLALFGYGEAGREGREAAVNIASMSLLTRPDLARAAIETLDAPEFTGDDHDGV